MIARRCSGFGLAVVLAVTVAHVAWADDGRPSRVILQEMGLGGLEFVSDSAALSIRGQGYSGGGKSSARAYGSSFATINTKKGTAHSEDGYVASGKHFAAGGSFSVAGTKVKSSHGGGGYGNSHRRPGMGGHTTVKSVKVFAGGSSWAKAF